jgi:hypothetical protein
MARGHRRKCKCCRELFHPNPRNLPYQRYCSKPRCRSASKTASHARWLTKPENRDYFHDPWHAERVRAWRADNPAIGARCDGPHLRYKMRQWRKLLILRAKRPTAAPFRYKRR